MRWTYRPELDGLRTIAVYLVLLFHTGLSWVEGGFVGVDLFFVLSGFLVSNVILSEIDRTGSLRVGSFYARRVRRLLPGRGRRDRRDVPVFVAGAPVGCRRLPMVERRAERTALLRQLALPRQSSDYFAADVDKSPFLHFWSLSIEEQFYLVLPAPPARAAPGREAAHAVAHRRSPGRHRRALHWPRWPPSSLGPRSTPPAPTTAPTPGSTSCSPAPCSPWLLRSRPPRPPRRRRRRCGRPRSSSASCVVGSGLLDVGPSAAVCSPRVASVLAIAWAEPSERSLVGAAALAAGRRCTSARSPTAPTSGTGRSSWCSARSSTRARSRSR